MYLGCFGKGEKERIFVHGEHVPSNLSDPGRVENAVGAASLAALTAYT